MFLGWAWGLSEDGGRAGRGRPCWSASRATKALAMRTSAQRGLRQRLLSGRPHLPCGRRHVGSGARMAHALRWLLWGQQDTGLLLSLWGRGWSTLVLVQSHSPAGRTRAAWALHSRQTRLWLQPGRPLSAPLTASLCQFPSKGISSASKCPARERRVSPGTRLYTDVHRSVTHNGQNVGPAPTPIPGGGDNKQGCRLQLPRQRER